MIRVPGVLYEKGTGSMLIVCKSRREAKLKVAEFNQQGLHDYETARMVDHDEHLRYERCWPYGIERPNRMERKKLAEMEAPHGVG